MFDYETLKLIWWLLVGVLLIGFAIMDGHDMGVGTLVITSYSIHYTKLYDVQQTIEEYT